ncbi:Scr1 family TA system antitoxin-like transcriptional regulator [Spirillospora sp. NPDC047279]|uniref:Scr1 family TA system antitoxin-like transcriptional regulator n=1 Tax=Spirillospora sp. NPDC047279 TaxID=3155478 RepID=UPI0033D86CEF
MPPSMGSRPVMVKVPELERCRCCKSTLAKSLSRSAPRRAFPRSFRRIVSSGSGYHSAVGGDPVRGRVGLPLPKGVALEAEQLEQISGRRQFLSLLESAVRSNVHVRIAPTSADAHPGVDGSFVLLSFAGPLNLDVAYLEGAAGVSVYLEDVEQLSRCNRLRPSGITRLDPGPRPGRGTGPWRCGVRNGTRGRRWRSWRSSRW